MIKRETADTIPLLHMVQQLVTIDAMAIKSKLLFDCDASAAYTTESALVH